MRQPLVMLDLARHGLEHPDDALEQRRLARAVGSDDRR